MQENHWVKKIIPNSSRPHQRRRKVGASDAAQVSPAFRTAETLEERTLLSALTFDAVADASLKLEVFNDGADDIVRVIDVNDSTSFATIKLADLTTSVTVNKNGFDVELTIDSTATGITVPVGFDTGAGSGAVVGPTGGVDWAITGVGAATLTSGSDTLTLANVNRLVTSDASDTVSLDTLAIGTMFLDGAGASINGFAAFLNTSGNSIDVTVGFNGNTTFAASGAANGVLRVGTSQGTFSTDLSDPGNVDFADLQSALTTIADFVESLGTDTERLNEELTIFNDTTIGALLSLGEFFNGELVSPAQALTDGSTRTIDEVAQVLASSGISPTISFTDSDMTIEFDVDAQRVLQGVDISLGPEFEEWLTPDNLAVEVNANIQWNFTINVDDSGNIVFDLSGEDFTFSTEIDQQYTSSSQNFQGHVGTLGLSVGAAGGNAGSIELTGLSVSLDTKSIGSGVSTSTLQSQDLTQLSATDNSTATLAVSLYADAIGDLAGSFTGTPEIHFADTIFDGVAPDEIIDSTDNTIDNRTNFFTLGVADFSNSTPQLIRSQFEQFGLFLSFLDAGALENVDLLVPFTDGALLGDVFDLQRAFSENLIELLDNLVVDDATLLSGLNSGFGVRTASGADLRIQLQDGTQFDVDLSSATDIGDVRSAIQTASGLGTNDFDVLLDANSGSFVIVDYTSGSFELQITSRNGSPARRDLGLDGFVQDLDISGAIEKGFIAEITQPEFLTVQQLQSLLDADSSLSVGTLAYSPSTQALAFPLTVDVDANVINGVVSSATSTTIVDDTTSFGPNDSLVGRQIRVNPGKAKEETRRIVSHTYDETTMETTITVDRAWSSTPTNSDQFKITANYISDLQLPDFGPLTNLSSSSQIRITPSGTLDLAGLEFYMDEVGAPVDRTTLVSALNSERGIATSLGTFSTDTFSTSGNLVDGDTMTIGSTTYTVTSSVSNAYDVLLGSDSAATVQNLIAAINGTGTSGTTYGTGTTLHPNVTAQRITDSSFEVTSKLRGALSSAINTSTTASTGSWLNATLTGGTDVNDIRVQLFDGTSFEVDLDHDPGEIAFSSTLVTGSDLSVTLRNGDSFAVDLQGATRLVDVVRLMEHAFAMYAASNSTVESDEFEIRISTSRGAITIIDFTTPPSSNSSNTISITDTSGSTAAADLGFDVTSIIQKFEGREAAVIDASFVTLGELITKIETAWQAHSSNSSLLDIRINPTEDGIDVIDGTGSSMIQQTSTVVDSTDTTLTISGTTSSTISDLTGYSVRFEWTDPNDSSIVNEAVLQIAAQEYDSQSDETTFTIPTAWDPDTPFPEGTVTIEIRTAITSLNDSPAVFGLGLAQIGRDQDFSDSAGVSELGFGLTLTSGDDLTVNLVDGRSFDLDLGNTGDYDDLTIAALMQEIIDLVGVNDFQIGANFETGQPVFLDFTTPTGSDSFSITQKSGSNIVDFLGIGTATQNTTDYDSDQPYQIDLLGPGVQQLSGNVVHGDEPGQHVGLNTTKQSKLTTNLTLDTSPLSSGLDITGTSGPFSIGVDPADSGEIEITFTSSHTFQDPENFAGSQFATFTELLGTSSRQMERVAGTPAITATLDKLDLEVGLNPVATSSTLSTYTDNVAVAASNIDLTAPGTLAGISLAALSPDPGNSSDLADLLNEFSASSIDDIIFAFSEMTDYLLELQHESTLSSNENLLAFVVPGLGVSVAELLDLGSTFDSLRSAIENAKPQTVQQLESVITTVLGNKFGGATLGISQDGDDLKIAFQNLDLGTKNVDLPFDLNLLTIVGDQNLSADNLSAAGTIINSDATNVDGLVNATISGLLDINLGIRSSVTGTATSPGSSTTLVDTNQSFDSFSDLVGREVVIVSGTGKGQVRVIKSVDSASQITLESAWSTTPDDDSEYRIRRSFLYGDSSGSETNLSVELSAGATDLNFQTLMRSTQVGIFSNKADGLSSTYTFHKKGDSTSAAEFTAILDSDANRASSAAAATTTELDAEVSTKLSLDYPEPLTDPDPTTKAFEFEITDLSNGSTSSYTLSGPPVDTDLGTVDLLENLDGFRIGFDQLMQQLDEAVKAKMFSDDAATPNSIENQLPLVGSQLEAAIDFIQQIRQKMSDNLSTESARLTPELARLALFEALGPGGLDWLTDQNGDGNISIADVQMVATSTLVTFDVGIEVPETTTAYPIDFASTLPALGLEIDTLVDVTTSFQMPNLQLGFSTGSEGAFLGIHPDFTAVEGFAEIPTGSSNTDRELEDSSASFSSTYIGKQVTIIGGTGQGQTRTIESVSSTSVLHVDNAWDTPLDATSEYRISSADFVITVDARLPETVIAEGEADEVSNIVSFGTKTLKSDGGPFTITSVDGVPDNAILIEVTSNVDLGSASDFGGSYGTIIGTNLATGDTFELFTVGDQDAGVSTFYTLSENNLRSLLVGGDEFEISLDPVIFESPSPGGGTIREEFELTLSVASSTPFEFFLPELTDSNANFDSSLEGKFITITSGPGAGQTRKILSVDSSTSITVDQDWDEAIGTDAAYIISEGHQGRMGILPVEIFDNPRGVASQSDSSVEVRDDYNLNTHGTTFLSGAFVVDLIDNFNGDDRLSLNELEIDGARAINGGFTGIADLNLQLYTNLPSSAEFPPYRMVVTLPFNEYFTYVDSVESAPSSIRVEAVQFELVGFMRDFVGPSLTRFTDAMEPLQGFLDFLNSAWLPVVSTFFPETTYAGGTETFGGDTQIGDFRAVFNTLEGVVNGGEAFAVDAIGTLATPIVSLFGIDLTKGPLNNQTPIADLFGEYWIDQGSFTVSVDDAREEKILDNGAINFAPIQGSNSVSYEDIVKEIGKLVEDTHLPASFAARSFTALQFLSDEFAFSGGVSPLARLVINLSVKGSDVFRPVEFQILDGDLPFNILLGNIAPTGDAEETILMAYETPDLFLRLQANIPLHPQMIFERFLLAKVGKAASSAISKVVSKISGKGGDSSSSSGSSATKSKKPTATAYPYLVVAFEARADFGMAVDAVGLQEYAVTGNADAIRNGFFLMDDVGVEDVPSLVTLNLDTGVGTTVADTNEYEGIDADQSRILGGIGLGWALELETPSAFPVAVRLSFGIDGTFLIGETLNLIDPNGDLKVRTLEFERQLENPAGYSDPEFGSDPKFLMYDVGIGSEFRIDVFIKLEFLVKGIPIPLLNPVIDAKFNVFTAVFPDIILNPDFDQPTPELSTKTAPSGFTLTQEMQDFLTSLGISSSNPNALYLNGADGLDESSSSSQKIYVGPDPKILFGENAGAFVSPNQTVSVSNGKWFETKTDTNGFDVIIALGGSGDDEFYVSPYLQVPVILIGNDGNDIMYAGGGPALLDGGAGDDTLIGSRFIDWIFGRDGADEIFGNDGDDKLIGGLGIDDIKGWRGKDLIYGDDEQLDSAGSGDIIDGGTDDDEIYGGSGADEIDGGLGHDFIAGEDGNDTIRGGDGRDEIEGGSGKDNIEGGLGNDTIDGGDGDDFILGGENRDDIQGGAGNDELDGEGASDEVRGGDGNDIITGDIGNDFLDGQEGSDDYFLGFQGGSESALVTVLDTGATGTDTDRFFATGTVFNDEFLIRAATNGTAFVALLNTVDAVERINYSGVERIQINGSFGDDFFAIDDTAAEITLNGDAGNDTFQVGQLFRSERTDVAANVDPGDVFATIETTRGFLSNGISFPMTINGGSDNDHFIVYHNKAVLTLNGESGDDQFEVKAFALVGSQEPERERTDITGGAGADLVEYAVNAPVNIDGGDGTDILVAIGTEFGDDFVLTRDGIYGAGLNINFTNIEKLRVDGAEGDDRFYIQSTSEDVTTELFGGLGNDTFNVSGDTPPVVSNDLLGHSGIVAHDAISLDPLFDGKTLFGISANVQDNDEAGIAIRQSDGSTIVTEGSLSAGGVADNYQVVLTSEPLAPVFVKALAPLPTSEERELRSRSFGVLSYHSDAVTADDGTSVTLRFDKTNWFIPQTVVVFADDRVHPTTGKKFSDPGGILTRPELGDSSNFSFDDFASEGVKFGFVNHIVTSGTDQQDGDLAKTNVSSLIGAKEVLAILSGTFAKGQSVSANIGGTVVSATTADEASTDLERSLLARALADSINNATLPAPVNAVAQNETILKLGNLGVAGDQLSLTLDGESQISYTLVTEDSDPDTFAENVAEFINSQNYNGVVIEANTNFGGPGSVVIAETVPSSGLNSMSVVQSTAGLLLSGQFAVTVSLVSDDADSTTEDETDFSVSSDSTGKIKLRLDGGNGTSTFVSAVNGAGLDLIGRRIDITSGPAAGQSRFVIADNGNGLLTLDRAWDSNDLPDSTSTYQVFIDDALVGTDAVSTTDTTFEVTGTVEAGDVFEVKFDGNSVTYTVQSTDTSLADIATGIANEINNIGPNGTSANATAADGTLVISAVSKLKITTSITVDGSTTDAGLSEVIVNGEPDQTFRFTAAANTFPTTGEGLTGRVLQIVGGAGVGQERLILSNTDSELVLNGDWTTPADETSVYRIEIFDGLAVPSVKVQINDNDELGIIVEETGDGTAVIEGSNGDQAGERDNIKVRLTNAPTSGTVNVTLVNPDGDLAFSNNTLSFTSSNATKFQNVGVRAFNDNDREGFHTGLIDFIVTGGDSDSTLTVPSETFTLADDEPEFFVGLSEIPVESSVVVTVDGNTLSSSRYEIDRNKILFLDSSGEPEARSGSVEVTYDFIVQGYSNTETPRFVVGIHDDEAPTVIVRESGGTTDVIELDSTLAAQSVTYDERLEKSGDFDSGDILTFTFEVPLNPTSNATLTFKGNVASNIFAADPSFEILLEDNTKLNVNSSSSGMFNQTFTISKSDLQAFASDGIIVFQVKGKDILRFPTNEVSLALDFDGTLITEGMSEDSYELVLSAAPTDDVTVTVTPEITKTTRTGGIRHDLVQLAISSGDSRVSDNGDGTLSVTFSPTDWDVPVRIDVAAIDDSVVDGGDTKVFAPGPNSVANILGPLVIEGGGGDGSLSTVNPLMLPGETNVQLSTGAFSTIDNNGANTVVTVNTSDLNAILVDLGVSSLSELVDKTIEVTKLADTTDPAILELLGQFRQIISVTENGTTTDLELNDRFYREEQMYDVTLSGTVDVGDEYALLVDGVAVSVVVTTEATLDDVAVTLANAINNTGLQRTSATSTGSTVAVTTRSKTEVTTAVLVDGGTTDASMSITALARTALTEAELLEYAITAESLNFFVDESTQIDFLFLHDQDSPADSGGLLTPTSITGLNMGPAGVEGFGITYGDLEVMELNLGTGSNNFRVQGTAVRDDGFETWTIINTGDVAEPGNPPTVDDTVIVTLVDTETTTLSGLNVHDAESDTDSGTATVLLNNSVLNSSPNRDSLKGQIVRTADGQEREIIKTQSRTVIKVDGTIESGDIFEVDIDGQTASVTVGAETTRNEVAFALINAINALGISGVTATKINSSGRLEVIANPDILPTVSVTDQNTIDASIAILAQRALITVSSVWENIPVSGDDVDIVKPADGRIAINTQGGDDVIDASGSTQQIIAFGGLGNDVITGGSGEDILFGDRGRVDFYGDLAANTTVLPIVTRVGSAPSPISGITTADPSTSDFPNNEINDSSASFTVSTQSADGLRTDTGLTGLFVDINNGTAFLQEPRLISGNGTQVLFIEPNFTETLDATSEYRISTYPEDQTDLVNRQANFITTIDDSLGGDDTINAGGGADQVFGGAGKDTITGGNGSDVIFGDAGVIDRVNTTTTTTVFDHIGTKSPTTGDDDNISGNGGNDIIFGGAGSDTLGGNRNHDVVFGDFGEVKFSLGTISEIYTTDAGHGAADTIEEGANDSGDDIILGGENSSVEVIDAGEGDNVVIGDHGKILYNLDSNLTDIDLIQSTNTTYGGSDDITTGAGTDIIIGGKGGDVVDADNGKNLVIGDAGSITAADADTPRFGNLPITLGIVENSVPADDNSGNTGGADTITTGTGDDIVLGGLWDDTISASSGSNFIAGDSATISYDTTGTNADLESVTSIDFDRGGADTITTLGGDDIILGGLRGDTIEAGNGHNIVFGDHGKIDWVGSDGDPADIDTIQSLSPSEGGNDSITTGNGDDIVIAGRQADIISAGSGDNIVIGDNGEITTAATGIPQLAGQPMVLGTVTSNSFLDGGADTITTLSGNDILLGGRLGDTITTTGGNNIVFGDDGKIVYDNDGDPSDIDEIVSLSTTSDGGADTINTGDGNDIVIAGRNADTIDAQDGDNIIIGDSGQILASTSGTPQIAGQPITLGTITTTEHSDGANDTINTLTGNDIILGGRRHDAITTTAGNNIVLGDDGKIVFDNDGDPSDIDEIVSLSTTSDGGTDTINTGDGNDIVIAGRNADTIDAQDGDNIIIGDSGQITSATSGTPQISGQPITLGTITTIEHGDGGNDSINTLTGDDIILGGNRNDSITTTNGANIIFGDDGKVIFAADGDASNVDSIESLSQTQHGGNDTIQTGVGDDIVIAGRGADTVDTSDGQNIVIGDNGKVLFDYTVHTAGLHQITSSDPDHGGADNITTGAGNDFVIGGTAGDTIDSGDGNDLVFGDNASIDGKIDAAQLPLKTSSPQFTFTSIDITNAAAGHDTIYTRAGEDIVLGQQGADTIFAGDDDDDVIGGHNVAGGHDGNDRLDGGAGFDVIAGDNATIDRRDDALNPRMRTLTGSTIYGDQAGVNDGDSLQDATHRVNPRIVGSSVERDIVLLDHSDLTSASFFGDDFIAGGADDDEIFGQLGSDTIQGDSSIDETASASRDSSGLLNVDASVDATTDGDDYIEGNGGDDIIFGNLGQDDIVGGSSTLYGLTAPSLRPDGSDFIFGGSATNIARLHFGSGLHAEDADTIAGDNANIYRLVNVTNSTVSGFLSFNYDNYGESRTMIPRAVELIDYTPGGPDFDATNAANDIGGGDEVHGESGDDTIYGMVGDDILFGDAADDDIIGGWGNDWISGGTGIDGVIGDDGRILTSRNDTNAEPLYGVAAFTNGELDTVIATGGNIQQATINVSAELKKTVNLTPYNLDPATGSQDPLFDPQYADDMIFGGLGTDFLHGGAGDDAISGAEALPSTAAMVGTTTFANGFDTPANPGDILGYAADSTRPDDFYLYDENNPMQQILVNNVDFLLNFNTVETINNPDGSVTLITNDGDDRIFGDLGNDWIVGGTGQDHAYGGWGNDLLNMDDDHTTNGGLNDVEDNDPTYADIAFGGAGRDILIANIMDDRLIDWNGEFNSYNVPFSEFGANAVSRSSQPQLEDYLYDLSKSDGADQTRAADDGTDAARNGEPNGEIGLVTQSDNAWQDQMGQPDDPQPGNTTGGGNSNGSNANSSSLNLLDPTFFDSNSSRTSKKEEGDIWVSF